MKNGILRSVKIAGTGSYLPESVVTNLQLERQVLTSDAWIRENLGIHERRIAAPHQATSDLAAESARRALDSAGLLPEDVDLVIVATATPDRPAPSTACIVQEKIGAVNAAAFDLNAVCSGFLYGLAVGSRFIATRMYDNVLLIGADTFSRITDWNDRACVFFGDGAGAAVLTHTTDGDGLLAIDLYADGHGKWNFTVPAGGSETPASCETVAKNLHTFRMNGRAVYETATRVLPDAIKRLLARCEMSVGDIDVLIPHQPSICILRVTAERLGLPFDKVLTNMAHYANTSGGTVPIMLDEANRSGLLKNNKIVAFAAVGAGWTWAAALMRWVR